jgi:cellulose synthase operon protein C
MRLAEQPTKEKPPMTHPLTPRRLVRAALMAGFATLAAGSATLLMPEPARAQAQAVQGTPLQKAQIYFQREDFRSAALELRNVIKTNPRDGQARLLSAQVALKLQAGIPAQTEIEAARRAGVPLGQTRLVLAEALVLQAKYADALREAEAGGIPPQLAADAARVRALAHMGMKDLTKARNEIGLAERTAPNNHWIFIDKARILGTANDRVGAEAAIDVALRLAPNNSRALLIKGDLIRARVAPPAGLNQALPYFEQVLKKEPLSIEARVERAATLVDLRREPEAQQEIQRIYKMTPDNPLALYLDAVMKSRARKFNEANALMSRTKGVLDSYPPALMLKGLVAFELNNIQQADAALTKVMEVSPGNPVARRLYGAVQIKKNDFDGAIQTFKPLIDSGQADAQVFGLSATAYARKNDFATAANHYERALQLDPGSETLKTQLAMARIAMNNTKQATQDLQSVLQKNPTSLQALMLLTLTDLRTRNFKSALTSAQRFVRAYPKLPLSYNMLGAAWLGNNNSAEAEKNFKIALQLKPDYHEARRNLANLYRVTGKFADAKRELQTVLATDRSNVRTMLALAQVASSQNKTEETVEWLRRAVQVNPKSLPPRLALANAYLRLGDRQKALTEASALDRDFPNNSAAVETLGKTQASLKQFGPAVGTFTRLTTIMPNSIQAMQLLGRAQWSNKEYDAARRSFQRALNLNGIGKNVVYLDLLNLEAERGNFDQAVAYANEMRKVSPDKSLADTTIGDLYMGAKQWTKAASAYEAAKKLGFTPKIAVNLSRAYRNMGNNAKAIGVLQEWLTRNPKDVPVRMAVADLHIATKNYPAAIAEYDTIMKGGNSSPAVLNNLAWALDKMNDKRALATAERAYKAAPDQPDIADTYGWILLRRQDKVKGLQVLQKSAVKRPNDPNMQYHLAFALKANGRSAEAARVLDSTLARFKTFDNINDARALLTQIKSGK